MPPTVITFGFRDAPDALSEETMMYGLLPDELFSPMAKYGAKPAAFTPRT